MASASPTVAAPAPPVLVLETDRCRLRQFSVADAPFLLALFNDASFLQFIGDKGVRTREDAVAFIEREYIASYERNGFGPWCVVLKGEEVAVGMCGLLRRDWLADVDLGYALLPAFWNRGIALEAASGVIDYATHTLGLRRVVAITDPTNEASMKLLLRQGFAPAGTVRKSEGNEPLNLFALDLA